MAFAPVRGATMFPRGCPLAAVRAAPALGFWSVAEHPVGQARHDVAELQEPAMLDERAALFREFPQR